MEEDKIFSVIIPVYNGEKTIERTLASLISNRDWIHEVIIVNDHCDDNTFEKVEPFKQWLPIKVIENQEIKNPNVSRTCGLFEATGDWVIFLDADDAIVATSLKYVQQVIYQNQQLDPLIIYPLRIVYNTGAFTIQDIHFFELSCVGNIYKRDYLIQNNLIPTYFLPLAEDEYFGQKIQIYINHCDSKADSLIPYPYPVYEVHHDNIDSLSMANWIEYLVHYHLLYQQYLTEDFFSYKELLEALQISYTENFIFCYFLYLCLLDDIQYENDLIYAQKIYFKDALEYAKRKLEIDKDFIIQYFINNEDLVTSIIQAAMVSNNSDPPSDGWSFEDFITEIEDMPYDENVFDNNSSL